MLTINNKHYRHIKTLGAGAQGEVRLIEDIETQKQYAFKVYNDVVPEKSIEREISILTQRSHPNLLQIIDCGRIENNFYTITKFAEEGSLDIYIKNGELTLYDRLLILRDALVGLEYIHNDNIIHRDIKPANIFIEKGKEYKGFLGDFGLAKSRDDSLMSNSVHGGLIGTVAFLTPEYLRNETRVLDAKSDLYAIGVSLYKCITGYYPYGETEQELLENLQNLNYKPPIIRKYIPSVPKELQDICERSLAINKQERFFTARQFIMNIEALLEEEDLNFACPKPGELKLHFTEDKSSQRRSLEKVGVRSKYKEKKKRQKKSKKNFQYILLGGLGCITLLGGLMVHEYSRWSKFVEERKDYLEKKQNSIKEKLIEVDNKLLKQKQKVIENYMQEAESYYKRSREKRTYLREAFRLYEKAAFLDSPEAQAKIGLMYSKGEGIYLNQKEALSWTMKAIVNGNTEAMINLGDFYFNGIGVDKDFGYALEYYKKAIEKGNYQRANVVGYAYIKGELVEQDIEGGINYYLKWNEETKGNGYFGLAELYRTGDGVEKNKLEAIKLYHKAIDKGSDLALLGLARLYRENKELAKAIEYYDNAVEKKVSNARVELGMLYLLGYSGNNKIQRMGFNMCMDAARDGEVTAQVQIGEIYQKGIGIVKANDIEAEKWFRKAAEQGSGEGAYKAAMLYANSQIFDSPLRTSIMIELLEKGVMLNHPNCMVSLGELLRKGGEDIQKDSSRALKLFLKAAEFGEGSAFAELGHIYIEGDGESKNINKAIEYYEKGVIAKDPIAHFMLGQIYDIKLSEAFNRLPQYAEAIYHYQQGYQLGHEASGSMLVSLYDRLVKKSTGIEAQMQDIVDDLNMMVTQDDDGASATLLGNIYLHGLQGVQKNYTKALECYKVADQKNSQGIHGYYGSIYLEGKGVDRDYKKAYQLFQKGALYNDYRSLYYLGVMYKKGIYVKKNEQKSREFLKKSKLYKKK